tara:strand:+ start:600 stop:749 length:150 start_codon:yes stop_codon:yes gene_type:complete
MPAKIKCGEILKEKEIQDSTHSDYSPCISLSDLSDSEIKWVQLHQMFDK